MRKLKSTISFLLAIVMLLSSVYVGGIVSFAEEATFTKIVNTFDDEGVVYETVIEGILNSSERTVDGTPDDYKFAAYGASIEKFDSSEKSNAVKFTYAVVENSSWPAQVKLYDNNAADKAQFKVKKNTSYSLKLKYNVTKALENDAVLELRQMNSTNPGQTLEYKYITVLVPEIARISEVTDGWVEVSTTFTAPKAQYLYLNLTSLVSDLSDFEVWVDDIEIEELYNVTVDNYTPGQTEVLPFAPNTKVSDIEIPTVEGFMFEGIYADAEYTQKLSSETVLDAYNSGKLYFKWRVATINQFFCGFENYKSVLVPSYDKTVASLVTDTVRNGLQAMKIALQSNGITAFEIRDKDAFNIVKGAEYSVSFAYKTDAAAEISLGFAKANDVPGSAVAITNATTTVTATDSWQTAEFTITADKGTSESYALAMLVSAENGANVYIDDILVTNLSFTTVDMPNYPTDTYPTLNKDTDVDVDVTIEIWNGNKSTSLEGDGTEAKPYLINNGADLAYAITSGGNDKYYKLTSDIYLNDLSYIEAALAGTAYNSNLNSWYYSVDNPAFSGSIDGDNHTVYGLFHRNTTNPTANTFAVALVPSVAAGKTVTIKNLGIDASYIEYRFQASAFVGIVNGADASRANVNIDNCYVGSQVKLKAYYSGAFKAYGIYDTTTITNSYSLATTEATSGVRGLIGYSSVTTTNISNTYNANGPVSTNTGGVQLNATVTNCYETEKSGNTTLFSNVVLVSQENMKGSDALTASNKMPKLNIDTKGLPTTKFTATDDYPVLTSFIEGANVEQEEGNIEIWDGSVSESLEGDGTEANPFVINNGADLAFAITSGGNDKYYKLTSDIYLNNLSLIADALAGTAFNTTLNSWYNGYDYPNGFSGTIDGDNHTIYGLYYRNTENQMSNEAYAVGLVPGVNAGQTVTIKNLGIDNAYVQYRFNTSAFVGLVKGASTTNHAYVNIDNCYVGSQVKIKGYNAGAFHGLCIYSTTTITNSYSLATTEASGLRGLFGRCAAVTINSSNTYNANGPFSTSSNGAAFGGTSKNCYETEKSNNTTLFSNVVLVSQENMKGSDALTASDKMPNLNVDAEGNPTNVFTATDDYPVLTSFVKVVNDESEEEIKIWDGSVSESLDGEGTVESPCLIKNGADLAFAITSGGNDKYYKLTSDIYLNDAASFNINTGYAYKKVNSWYTSYDYPSFAGTIDGDGHTVYGLYYRDASAQSGAEYAVALVPGVLSTDVVTIKNLGIDKSFITYKFQAAAFVGIVKGNGTAAADRAVVNIDRCYVGSQVKIQANHAGAFQGYNILSNTTITNSYSLATTVAKGDRGLIGHYSAISLNAANSYNANGPISSSSDGKAVTASVTNCYETEDSYSTLANAVLVSQEKMKGSDVLINAAKMPNLGSAFKAMSNSVLEDYYFYLPAGTAFAEEYDVDCFDSLFAPLNYTDVFNTSNVMTRGAHIRFKEIPNASTILVPSDSNDLVRSGSMFELYKDNYFGDRIRVVRKTLASQPENAVNYLFMTDQHFTETSFLSDALINQVKLVVETANDDPTIDFICMGGDAINGNGYADSAANVKETNLKLLHMIYAPLLECKKPVFVIQGNHDDGGWNNVGGFKMNTLFSFKDWRDNIINRYVNRTIDGTEIKVVNNSADDNPKYYYYDLKNKDTRVIVLDSIDYDMEYDPETGIVTGLEVLDESLEENDFNRYKNGYSYWGYSKEQLQWVANKALGELPSGYDVVFLSHMGIDESTVGADYLGEHLKGILRAYQNRLTYVNEDVAINVDYSEAQGTIRSFQFGHDHRDRKYYSSDMGFVEIATGQANRSSYLSTEGEARFDVMSVTNEQVYKMGVGTQATTLKMYYSDKVSPGDVNQNSEVDICDLVHLKLVKKGLEPKTTAADIMREGMVPEDNFEVLRKFLIGDYEFPAEPLLSDSQKTAYTPSNVTLTPNDENSYGVTWQTDKVPYDPVVQVSLGDTFDSENYVEFKATFAKSIINVGSDSETIIFVSTAVMTGLEPNTTYTYRCYDKTIDVAGESFTFTTGDNA